MIQIDETTRNLLLNNSVNREIILRFPDDDFEITGSNIVSESFELTQSICDDKEFHLGGGVAGKMEVQTIGVDTELSGKRVNVFLRATYSNSRLVPSQTLVPSQSLIIGEQRQSVEIQLFSGKIYSAKRQKNRSIKKLVAYDLMYELSKLTIPLDVLTSYVTRRVETNPNNEIAAKTFITDMVNLYFDDYVVSIDLNNSFSLDTSGFPDNRNMPLHLNNTYITGAAKKGVNILKLLQAYAEMNDSCVWINRNGDVYFKSLIEKSNSGFVKESVNEVILSYKNLSFDEFTVQPIHYARFKYADKSISYFGNSKRESCYLSENILMRFCSSIGNQIIVMQYGNRLIGSNYCYQPYKAEVFSRWWLEPGDRVQIKTGYTDVETIDTFIFSRTIKGVNGMKVTIEAKGVERLGEKEGEERNG